MSSPQTRDTVVTPAVESLEGRVFLSGTVNVSSGYQDATSAIQNALNGRGSGGTVNLGGGTYNVSSQLTIPSGVKLEGNKNATLNWTGGGNGYLLYSPWNSNGTTVDGVTFNGAGYKLDPQGTNLTISNNQFQNISFSSSYYGNGLYIPDQESNSTITGNTFYNITGNVGIYIFNPVNVQITNNNFTSDGEAIKGQWFNGGSNDLIANNTLSQIYRFGIECQGNPNNLTVSGNRLSNWQQRDSHIGLSIATGEGNGINITNNTILGSGISNPSTAYTAIEAMGNNLTISGNYGVGWGWAELVGYTNHWVTTNNTWGVNTAVWVTESGGTAPAVNSGNNSASMNAFGGSASGSASSTPSITTSAPTTTTTPTTTTAPTSTPTTTTAPTPSPVSTSSSAGLPSGWSDMNMGNYGVPGSASYSNGVYTVSGAGSDVWYYNDDINYAYKSASSSSTITARVASAGNTAQYSKAGIMVRSSLSSNAANVYLYAQADGRIIMTDRASTGGSTVWPGGGNYSGPVYLRLVSSGNTVKGYYSTDGSNYTYVASVTLSQSVAYAGLAVNSQNTSVLDTATFDNVSVG